MEIRPIDDSCLETAAAMLKKGFPERSAVFWDDVLRRLSSFARDIGVGPIGHLMLVREAPVGIVLTVGSRRGDRHVVNLSSWYVEEKHRWLAPRMLQRVVGDERATYTDLSPTPEAARINERLGFRTVSEKVLVLCLPWTALSGRLEGEVIPLDRLPAEALLPADLALLTAHRDLGCLCGAFHHEGRYRPLIFTRTRKYGLPVARLLFAESRSLIVEARVAIARFLLRAGLLLLAHHARRTEHIPTAMTWKNSAPVQVKGDWNADRIDLAFSELVFLRL